MSGQILHAFRRNLHARPRGPARRLRLARSIRRSALAFAILVPWLLAMLAPLTAEAHDSGDLRGPRGHFDPTRLLERAGSFRAGGSVGGAPDAAPLASTLAQTGQGPGKTVGA